MMLVNNTVDLPYLSPAEPTALLQSDRIQPELCDFFIALNMNMMWFVSVTRIEEKPKRTNPKHCGHLIRLPIRDDLVNSAEMTPHKRPAIRAYFTIKRGDIQPLGHRPFEKMQAPDHTNNWNQSENLPHPPP